MATMNDCSGRPPQEIYGEVKKFYDDAFQAIDKGLKFDESGKPDDAIGMYEFGLTLIDQALSLPIESPTSPDIEWEKTYALIQKMRKSRKEILSRISDAQSRQHPEATVPPPSYEEAMASGSSVQVAPQASASGAYASTSMSSKPAVLPPYIPASATIDANLHNNPAPQFSDLTSQLSEMRVAGNREIIYSHNNVRLYFIAPDGRVSATSEPDLLIIGRIEDMTHDDILDDTLLSIVDQLSAEGAAASGDGEKHRRHGRHHGHRHRRHHRHHGEKNAESTRTQGTGQVYLQVGSWVYPLIPGISPVFRTDYGAFILPDVHSEVPGAAVGLILPSNADASVYELLTSILFGVVGEQDMPKETPKPPTRTRRSDRTDRKTESVLATNIVKGATYLANNLVRGAGSASRFIDAAAPRIMNRMDPATEPQPINPTLKKTATVAKTVTGKAATVTDYLAGKVGSAASALGQYLAPHIQNGGTKLLTSTTKMSSQEASTKVESILGATAGAVQGIATVYTGLETAAGVLGRSLSNNTVQIIEYKYGKPSAELSGDAISTAGNVYNIHHNYKFMKPTKLAKTVAKSTIKEAGCGLFENAHSEFSGSGPGDGRGFGPLPAGDHPQGSILGQFQNQPGNQQYQQPLPGGSIIGQFQNQPSNQIPNVSGQYQNVPIGSQYPNAPVGAQYPYASISGQYPNAPIAGQYPSYSAPGPSAAAPSTYPNLSQFGPLPPGSVQRSAAQFTNIPPSAHETHSFSNSLEKK